MFFKESTNNWGHGMLRKWEELPKWMQTKEVRQYYDLLSKRKVSLVLKRIFDITTALILLFFLVVPMIVISVWIVLDSKGGVFYRQVRVTSYGKKFRIHKFRTMVANAEKIGSQVTAYQDQRVTRAGTFLRKYRLDELPQLIDILENNMSFVGTRPESTAYIPFYTKEMCATLLLPAGITSEASIRYKDEARLLSNAENVDKIYIEKILPEKMKYNLESIRNFSFLRDIKTMWRTVATVFLKQRK